MDLLLKWAEDSVTKDMEEVKVPNVFFTFIFTGQTCLQQTQVHGASEKVCSKEDLPQVEEDHISAHTSIQENWWDVN